MCWEQKAKVIYKDHPALRKAMAAGRNIDNSLVKEYSKMGVSDCRFPMDQYLAYFDYEILRNYGLAYRI